jgi:hypothetical protein
MKTLFTIFLILTVFAARSQSVFNFKKDMVWVENAKLFVCKYEVTNVEYREFTDEILRSASNENQRQLVYDYFYPDTTVWVVPFKNGMGDPMFKYYRWHPGFNGHPVVGVSHKAAMKYCEWLTEKYGEGKYRFRLPTRKEFINYAKVGSFPLPGGLENPRNDKGQYLLNYKPNKINLNDSISHVYYNPGNDTFYRSYIDSSEKRIAKKQRKELNHYTYYVENSLNGYFYAWDFKNFLKIKIRDSIIYYDPITNSYRKEKLTIHAESNYYEDGYMYSSPTRGTNNPADLIVFDENGKMRLDYVPKLKYNQSSFPADKNGLYDLAGNVSEMVAEENGVMGGNWDSEANELEYDIEYDEEDRRVLIGFRIVAEPIK